MRTGFGNKLTEALKEKEIIPFIGVYDTFSASIAARSFDGIFISGFSFAASFYGLPDIGLISWSDIVAFARRVRTILPDTHILVDIDDGYADAEVAAHVVSLLEATGVSGIILEDQKRPKRCGHLDCKQILELDDFMPKLERVLETRDDMIVVARTDADEFDEAVRRVKAFDKAGADWVLVDGIGDMETVRRLRMQTGKPIVFNQIAGGKSPFFPLSELKTAGISVPLYSTPCLFAAQESIQEVMRAVKSNDGLLTSGDMSSVDLASCQALLEENLVRRDIHQ
jgi:2-methylisocitrate lyase-like PEP mutase family enzyme